MLTGSQPLLILYRVGREDGIFKDSDTGQQSKFYILMQKWGEKKQSAEDVFCNSQLKLKWYCLEVNTFLSLCFRHMHVQSHTHMQTCV